MMEAATRSAIDAALAQSNAQSAARIALEALEKGQRDALLYRLVADQCTLRGDYAGAHGYLQHALRLAPRDPAVLTDVAAVWRLAGKPDEALKIFDAMADQGLDYAPAWLEQGHALLVRNDFRRANQSYRRAALADPDCVDALAAIAETAVQLGDSASAREFADRALAIDPKNAVAQLSLAQLEIDDRRYSEAEARLVKLLEVPDLPDHHRMQSLCMLGDALDGTDRTQEAFKAYAGAKSLFRALYSGRYGDERRGQSALIGHVHAGFRKARTRPWLPIEDRNESRARGHVFLLGYPRSGTTLVENILAGLPDVVALEEKPTLADTEPLLGSEHGIERLPMMGRAEADHYRLLYWQRVASFGVDVRDKILVDMDPLKGIYLPVIARLFPHARIVVMRRDPRDVIWSCFRRNFGPTPAAYAFSSLESAARHYDALMSLTQECLDALPLETFVVRYDELVTGFDAVTRRLCSFVGVDWVPEAADFSQTAERRGVTTASVRQIRRGLFDGTNQWRRYQDELRPILPILQPWIERFGFDG